MRYSTDDGRFGVVIAASLPTYDSGFFTFQLVIGGELVGDAEASIIYSGIQNLLALPASADPRLAPSADPTTVLQVWTTDEVVHDHLLRSWTESLDGWCLLGYFAEDTAIWIAQEYDPSGVRVGPVLSTYVPIREHKEIVEQVAAYFGERLEATRTP